MTEEVISISANTYKLNFWDVSRVSRTHRISKKPNLCGPLPVARTLDFEART